MSENNDQQANVISISGTRGNVIHPSLAQVEAYWNALRGDREVPLRSEIDPRGIDRALEHAFILERIAPGVSRFRLAGMHLNDLMGMEVRGMPVTSFFTPEGRQRIGESLEHVFEQPARARIQLTGEAGVTRPKLTAEMVLLPLKSDLGDISRALGCMVATGQIGRTPHRFDVQDVVLDALSRSEAERATVSGYPRPEAPAPQPSVLAESPSSFTGKPTGGSEKPGKWPHLRLVHVNDKPS